MSEQRLLQRLIANEASQHRRSIENRLIRDCIVRARYVHLSGCDIDAAYDEMHGLTVREDDEDEPQVRECGHCQELNEPEAAYCMRCGYALKGETAADFKAEVEDDMKQDYAETDPVDASTREKIDTIDDPDVKTALLERIGAAE